MAEFKLVLNHPKGKSVQRELKDDAARALIGKKIGEKFKGEAIDLPGYEFEITGGSDAAGFPMRRDVDGSQKKKITAFDGVGFSGKKRKPNPKKKGWRKMEGMKRKKTVAGNTVGEKTAQINLKVLKEGKEKLFAEAPEPKAEEKKEAPAEEEEQTDDTDDKLKSEIDEIDAELEKDKKEIDALDAEEKAVEKELDEEKSE